MKNSFMIDSIKTMEFVYVPCMMMKKEHVTAFQQVTRRVIRFQFHKTTELIMRSLIVILPRFLSVQGCKLT